MWIITDDATIADADIQTFIDRLITMGGAVYDTIQVLLQDTAPTFDEMVAATTIDVESAGPISFKALASATTVKLPTTYTTKITSVRYECVSISYYFDSGADDQKLLTTLH